MRCDVIAAGILQALKALGEFSFFLSFLTLCTSSSFLIFLPHPIFSCRSLSHPPSILITFITFSSLFLFLPYIRTFSVRKLFLHHLTQSLFPLFFLFSALLLSSLLCLCTTLSSISDVEKPIIVRMRGTNAVEAKKLIDVRNRKNIN